MSWNFELVQPPYGAVSEGPVWTGTILYYSQIQACRIMAFDPQTNSTTVHLSDTNYTNGLVIDASGFLYACEGGARRVTRYEADGTVSVLADRFEEKRLNMPNDLVSDCQGRIWFTDPFYEGAAGPFSFDRANKELNHDSVYRLTQQPNRTWSIERMTFDTTRPNGLLFSIDSQTLYVAQSGRRQDEKRELRGYPLNKEGQLDNYWVLHDFGEHRGVDGMCLDDQGNIIATAGWELGGPGPSIYVFSPSGDILETHPVPATRPTNCAFGDNDLQTLYVTTLEGHLFRARTERRGLECIH